MYAIVKDNIPVQVNGPFTDSNGIQHPASALRLWTEQELKAVGVYQIEETSIPEGEYSTGWELMFDGESVLRIHNTAAIDIDSFKERYKRQIDAQAEYERLKYITGGAGQAMTYQYKAAEALRFFEDEDPKEENYPLLTAEIGVTELNLQGVADVVRQKHNEWLYVGGLIEKERLKAKRAIDDATSTTAIKAVVAHWP